MATEYLSVFPSISDLLKTVTQQVTFLRNPRVESIVLAPGFYVSTPQMFRNVFEGVLIKWRFSCIELSGHFPPAFKVALLSCCLVRVTQWQIKHLCSGFEKNGNIGRFKQRKKQQILQPSGYLMRIVRALFHVSRTFRFSGRTKRTEQAGFILEEMELVTMCSGTNIFKFISGAAQAIKLNLLTHKLYGKRSTMYFFRRERPF